MRKYILLLSVFLLISCSSEAQNIPMPSGKTIYIPKDLQNIDLQNPESKWSYHRMACADNFVIFWEKGFGNDLSNPPQMEGHPAGQVGHGCRGTRGLWRENRRRIEA